MQRPDVRSRYVISSRDPAVLTGLRAQFVAAGLDLAGRDELAWPGSDTKPDDRKVLVLGAREVERAGATRSAVFGQLIGDRPIVVGLTGSRLSPVLAGLEVFGRPRQGDALIILDRPPPPLDAVLDLAREGYLAIPAPTAGPMITETLVLRSAACLGADDHRVLRLLVTGDSNRQIAARLGLSESYVKTRLRTIMRRLNLPNRTAAAVAAYKLYSACREFPPTTTDPASRLPQAMNAFEG